MNKKNYLRKLWATHGLVQPLEPDEKIYSTNENKNAMILSEPYVTITENIPYIARLYSCLDACIEFRNNLN